MTAGTDHLISLARPGGRIVCTIWRGEALAAAGDHLGRAIAEATKTPPPEKRPAHLFDRINQPDSYAAWLTERGLSEVDVTVNEHDSGNGVAGDPRIRIPRRTGETPPDTVDAVRELYLASLSDEGVTELDATTLIGSGHRAYSWNGLGFRPAAGVFHPRESHLDPFRAGKACRRQLTRPSLLSSPSMTISMPRRARSRPDTGSRAISVTEGVSALSTMRALNVPRPAPRVPSTAP
ncbi:hypothetical protein DMH04_45965 [Kibdelosporangium aridum]|uniref:Uncharacterized protein n=1 Tax=Kibdelosporangium aridum TaxID=2030 RepID=A0A428YNA1_KIBAR|nr:hypothetical protein DMH04_45965 [Kibdelosporangium aridum]